MGGNRSDTGGNFRLITVYSSEHKLRDANTELCGGELVRPFERPSRAEHIHDRVKATGLGAIQPPSDFGLETVLKVHDPDYVDFLSHAWSDWVAQGYRGEAIASCWPARRMVQRKPVEIDGLLGYYSLAAETSITQGTWQAALASKNVALAGADLLQNGERVVFSLCRPPGHHAAIDLYGGYCFLNNAAIAAQLLLDSGAERIAILDVDYHHGNGTQDIFYQRDDVLFLSLHAAPAHEFPHFLGYADEKGAGKGEGYNINYPMPRGVSVETWFATLDHAIAKIQNFAPDAVVVSLGVDTFKDDPISSFQLETDDFTRMGRQLASIGLPALFVMEGGYDVSEIGVNTVNVLSGFESRNDK